MSTTCCACLARITVLMSKGFTLIVSSLHHNFSGHLRVNRAKIRITPRPAEGERDLHIRRFRLQLCVGRKMSRSGAQPRHSEPQRHQQNCSRHTSPHDSSPFSFCIWTSENSCLCLDGFHASEESTTASACCPRT